MKTSLKAILAAAAVAFAVTACAPTEQAGKPEPELTPAQVEEYATAGRGYLAACLDGTAWACDVDSVQVFHRALQVNYRVFDRPADDLARVWHTTMTAGNTSPMPDLLRVDVISAAGKRGSYTEYGR